MILNPFPDIMRRVVARSNVAVRWYPMFERTTPYSLRANSEYTEIMAPRVQQCILYNGENVN